MKTNPFSSVTAGITAALLVPAWALDAPADNAPPPPAVPGTAVAPAAPARPSADAAKPAATAAAAFLGVVSAAVPGMLAEHLDLKPGAGIVVQALMPDGPAAKAGIAVHDVITRVAGQPVGSAVDLTRQVAACKPGETIHLDVIHKGQAAGIDVTLGTRPDAVTTIDPRPLDQLNLDGIPKDLADRVRGAIEGNLGELDMGADDGTAQIAPQMQEAMREMKKRMQNAVDGLNAPDAEDGPKIEVQQGSSIRLMDEQGSIELKSNGGGKEVTIRDNDNKITWHGAWDTEQDKAAAPEDVRQRVARLNIDSKYQGNGLRLRFRGAGQPGQPGQPDE
jgi:hypothetical protein